MEEENYTIISAAVSYIPPILTVEKPDGRMIEVFELPHTVQSGDIIYQTTALTTPGSIGFGFIQE